MDLPLPVLAQGQFCSSCGPFIEQWRLAERMETFNPKRFLSMKRLGTLEEIGSRPDCTLCRTVYSRIQRDPYPRIDVGVKYHLISPVHTRPWHLNSLLIATDRWQSGGIMPETRGTVILISSPTGLNSDLRATFSKVSMGDVKRHVGNCDDQHEQCRNYTRKIRDAKPVEIILIDLEKGCLVPATTAYRYIAFSYVRGGAKVINTTNETLDDFRAPGSLRITSKAFPRAVSDVAVFVTEFGERYLWIDSLCIIQDDEETKHTQIMQMDIIYRMAYLTIIAHSGTSADSPLPGVFPGTRLQPVTVEDVQYSNGTRRRSSYSEKIRLISLPPSDLGSIIDESVYESRGWTMQEHLLSQRCLYFTEHQIFFRCCVGCAREAEALVDGLALDDDSMPSNRDYNALNEFQTIISRDRDGPRGISKRDISTLYKAAVKIYTQRSLSFESDIVNAFFGIASALEMSHGGCVLYGLPECILDRAILWVPSATTCQRSPIRMSTLSELDRTLAFPSWSWAGWDGPVQYFDEICDRFNLELRLFSSDKMDYLNIYEEDPVRKSSNDAFQPISSSVDRHLLGSSRTFPLGMTLPLGTLAFSALISDASQFRCLQQKSVPSWKRSASPNSVFNLQSLSHSLIDDSWTAEHSSFVGPSGQVCGILFDHGRYASNTALPDDCKLLRIGTSGVSDRDYPQAFNDDIRWGISIGAQIRDMGANTIEAVVIMLISWKEEHSERLAIGVIDSDTWSQSGPKIQPIRLM